MPRINDSFINRNGIRNRNCGKLFTHGSFSFLLFFTLSYSIRRDEKSEIREKYRFHFYASYWENNVTIRGQENSLRNLWKYKNPFSNAQLNNWISWCSIEYIYIWNIIKFFSIFLNSFFIRTKIIIFFLFILWLLKFF